MQDDIKQYCKSAYGKSYEIKVTNENGYYSLWIGERFILSIEGAENFFYALIGFEQGLEF